MTTRRKRSRSVWDTFVINAEKGQDRRLGKPERKRKSFSRATPDIFDALFDCDGWREREAVFATYEAANKKRCKLNSYQRSFKAKLKEFFLEQEQSVAV